MDVGAAADKRGVHELLLAHRGRQVTLATVQRLPFVAIAAPGQMQAVLAVLGGIGEQGRRSPPGDLHLPPGPNPAAKQRQGSSE